MSESQLERLLYPPVAAADLQRPLPAWSDIHQELKTKGVTLTLLWHEYKANHPNDGLHYSRFCDRYRAWRGKLSLSMRQTHIAGEKMFVDYAGPTLSIIDRDSGETLSSQVFVAVLGASYYTYAEATWSQNKEDWVNSHVRAFKFFGGVPEIVVPDNLKSGVTSPCRYDPELNPTYSEMANHYGVAVIPARVRKPKDKSKAEGGVLLVERWIMAVLRHRQFFSLDEANSAISELLIKLNDRPFQKLPGSRRSQFEALDQPALLPLPPQSYEYADWSKSTVGIDYHIEVHHHYYSVPYQLFRKVVDVRISAQTVEFFLKGKKVSSHLRSDGCGQSTIPAHMPEAHRAYAEQSPEQVINWSRSVGNSVVDIIEIIIKSKRHPQQGFNACMGLKNLGKQYSNERLDAACSRAIKMGCTTLTSIRSILKTNLDQQSQDEEVVNEATVDHDNIRGPNYFNEKQGEMTC